MSIGPLHAEARTRTLTGVQILGTGRYLPDNVVTNHDLLALARVRPRMDRQPDGDHRATVRPAPPGDQRPGVHAANRAASRPPDATPSEVDLLVVGTFTPDMCFPSTA